MNHGKDQDCGFAEGHEDNKGRVEKVSGGGEKKEGNNKKEVIVVEFQASGR